MLVEAHVLLPVVCEHFSCELLLLLLRQRQPLLVLEEGLVFFLQADSKDVGLRVLSISLGETQTVHFRSLGQ